MFSLWIVDLCRDERQRAQASHYWIMDLRRRKEVEEGSLLMMIG
jgi:hypothetical protein